jgi:ketosteroid isomerase-like protein
MPIAGAPAEAELRDITARRLARQMAACLNNDIAAWAAYYAPDVVAMPSSGHAIHGRDSLSRHAHHFWQGYRFVRAEANVEEAIPLGDLALVRTRITFDREPAGGGPLVGGAFKCLEVWTRLPGGEWTTIQAIWNSGLV